MAALFFQLMLGMQTVTLIGNVSASGVVTITEFTGGILSLHALTNTQLHTMTDAQLHSMTN
jgi:hypothetical protein